MGHDWREQAENPDNCKDNKTIRFPYYQLSK